MSNLIQVQQATIYHNAEIEVRVFLADMEQPIVMIDKIVSYNNATGNYNKEPRKFRINEIVYVFDTSSYANQNETLSIVRLNGNFFLKGNKKIGGKTDTIYLSNTHTTEKKLITDQIPTHLHDYAKQELQTNLKSKLDYMLQKGVVI